MTSTADVADSKVSAPRVYLLGAGRVGSALSVLLQEAGVAVVGQWSRSERGAERARQVTGLACGFGEAPSSCEGATLLLVAVSDDAIAPVVEAAAARGMLDDPNLEVVLHCSGAQPAAEVLAAAPTRLARGTFHPLVAVTDSQSARERLPYAMVALEGQQRAVALSEVLARAIGVAQTIRLRADQLTLYHVAAVIASNHSVALWHAAASLLSSLGFADPTTALLPLLQSTLENLRHSGLPESLTGPVRRGDSDTVRRHLTTLRAHAPHLVDLYRQCTLAALDAVSQLTEQPQPEAIAALRELCRAAASE